ncbi:hypothetical protein M885DRAFT_298704 [Pelagophyceae sp. CCMP2097]|nr:hypothetical protein M885DRAFT_298704 [Pelagophyceae sp. CCMP2097]
MLCLGELPGVNVDYWNTLGKRPEPRPASGSRGRPGGLAATQPLPGAAHPTSPRGPRRPSPDARGRRPSWAARGVTQQHRVLRTLSPTQRTQRRRSVPATIERAASLGEVLRAPVYEAAQVAFEESYDVESLTTQQLLAPEKDDWHDDESEIDCRAPKPRTGRALWDLVLSRGGRQRSSSRASLRSLLNAAAEPGATARAARPASHGDARTLALLSRISATKALQLPHCLAPSGAHALTTALRAPWTKTLVSQIRVVDLRHNGLAAAGLGDLVCVVLENAFELKTLDLSGNVVGGDPSPFVQNCKRAAFALARLHRKVPSKRILQPRRAAAAGRFRRRRFESGNGAFREPILTIFEPV